MVWAIDPFQVVFIKMGGLKLLDDQHLLGKNGPFEDVSPIENGDFPLLC